MQHIIYRLSAKTSFFIGKTTRGNVTLFVFNKKGAIKMKI